MTGLANFVSLFSKHKFADVRSLPYSEKKIQKGVFRGKDDDNLIVFLLICGVSMFGCVLFTIK